MRMLVEEGSAIAPLSARFARASNCVSFALALLKGRAEQLPPAQAFELLSVVDNVARMQPRLGEWVARQSHYADPRSTRAVLEDALRFQPIASPIGAAIRVDGLDFRCPLDRNCGHGHR